MIRINYAAEWSNSELEGKERNNRHKLEVQRI